MRVIQPKYQLFALAVLTAAVLVGCSKDDSVGPCAAHNDQGGVEGKMNGEEAIDVEQLLRGRGPVKGDDREPGISDDGDDVGDGERNRKKKPNS